MICFAADTLVLFLRDADLRYQWVGNLFLLAEFVLFSIYFHRTLGKPAWLPVVACMLVAAYTTHTLRAGYDTLNFFAASLLCIAYLLYAMAAFYLMLQKLPAPFPERTGVFWVSCALLLYSGATTLLFLFADEIDKMIPEKKVRWSAAFLIMNLFKVGLLFPAIRAKHRTWKSSV